MRQCFVAATLIASSILPTFAQNAPHPQPKPGRSQDLTSDAKRAELDALIERARKRQSVVNARNTRLWERWTYAVCIGCGDTPTNARIVHTTPARVLAGIPAADDDAREQAMTSRRRRI